MDPTVCPLPLSLFITKFWLGVSFFLKTFADWGLEPANLAFKSDLVALKVEVRSVKRQMFQNLRSSRRK
jgi:hypothetical protein